MLAEKWANIVIFVARNDHHCLKLSFLVGTIIVSIISGLSAEDKDAFHNTIICFVAVVPDEEVLLIGGDFSGHVGEYSAGFEVVHEAIRYSVINQVGLQILDFCAANKLTVANTFFQKNISRLIIYSF